MKRHYSVDNGDANERISIFIDGAKVDYVYAMRVGSKGWIDSYDVGQDGNIKVSRCGTKAKRKPRMRGHVTVVMDK